MMLLTPTDTPLYRRVVHDYPDLIGWMITPRKRGIPGSLKAEGLWAVDNDCYNLGTQFDLDVFADWLAKFSPYRERCLFAPAPDVVGDWQATLERFHNSVNALAPFPVAICLQNGATIETVPWQQISAVFVGGVDGWKLGQDVIGLLDEAGKRGKWRHVGRVNSQIRIYHFWRYADSFDGTGFAIEPDGKLRWALPLLRSLDRQPPLFEVLR